MRAVRTRTLSLFFYSLTLGLCCSRDSVVRIEDEIAIQSVKSVKKESILEEMSDCAKLDERGCRVSDSVDRVIARHADDFGSEMQEDDHFPIPFPEGREQNGTRDAGFIRMGMVGMGRAGRERGAAVTLVADK